MTWVIYAVLVACAGEVGLSEADRPDQAIACVIAENFERPGACLTPGKFDDVDERVFAGKGRK